MTTQEKCLFIIKEFEMSARQVGLAIGVAAKTASAKMKNQNYNKFLDEDFEKLKSSIFDKVKKIKDLN